MKNMKIETKIKLFLCTVTQKVKERYLRRRNEVSEEEAKLAGDIQMKALIKQIDDYNERSESDALIAAYKTDVYHNTIEVSYIRRFPISVGNVLRSLYLSTARF